MPHFLWLRFSSTFKITCELQGQSPAGLASHLPQFNFCGFRESVLYFLYHTRAEACFWSPGSAVPCLSSSQMLLGTPAIVCCLIFMYKCQWLKQPSSALQNKVCQTNMTGLKASARNLRELILCVTKSLSNLVIPLLLILPQKWKKVCTMTYSLNSRSCPVRMPSYWAYLSVAHTY